MYKQAIYSSQDSERGSPSEIFWVREFVPPCFFTQLGHFHSTRYTIKLVKMFFLDIYIYSIYIYSVYTVYLYTYIYIRQIIKNNFLVPQNFGCPKASTFHCKASQDTMTSFQLAISLHIKRSVTSYNVAQHLTMQCIVLQQSITSHNVV